MMKNINVLITGASSGIGEALAEYYAANGAARLFAGGMPSGWKKLAPPALLWAQRFLPKFWMWRTARLWLSGWRVVMILPRLIWR